MQLSLTPTNTSNAIPVLEKIHSEAQSIESYSKQPALATLVRYTGTVHDIRNELAQDQQKEDKSPNRMLTKGMSELAFHIGTNKKSYRTYTSYPSSRAWYVQACELEEILSTTTIVEVVGRRQPTSDSIVKQHANQILISALATTGHLWVKGNGSSDRLGPVPLDMLEKKLTDTLRADSLIQRAYGQLD